MRLQSGPLACVYQDEDVDQEHEGSGVYRAFSGSAEAEGASESEALDSLDRRLSSSAPPIEPEPEESATAEAGPELLGRGASQDTDHCPPRFQSLLPPANAGVRDTLRAAPDTVPSPSPSLLPEWFPRPHRRLQLRGLRASASGWKLWQRI